MQGRLKILTKDGEVLLEIDATKFPLTFEATTYSASKEFLCKHTYMEDAKHEGYKDRTKIKGIVLIAKGK